MTDLINLTRKTRAARARQLGFESVDTMMEAEYAASRAYHEDDEMAALAVHYMRRDAAHRAASRAAASASRRSKWTDLQPVALSLASEIQDARPDLSRSRLVDLVLDRLAADHKTLPSKTTISGWLKKVDN